MSIYLYMTNIDNLNQPLQPTAINVSDAPVIPQVNPPTSPPLTEAVPNKRSTKKYIIITFLTISLFVTAILFFIFFNSSGVTSAADKVHSELGSGQIQKVYSESMFRDSTTFAEFTQMMGMGSAYDITQAKHIRWTGRGFENNIKYVYGEFEFPNGTTQVITYEFIRSDGELILNGIYGGAPK
jgi:hypothetical protein